MSHVKPHRTESASGRAFQPPAAAERAARIDGPAARHSAANSVQPTAGGGRGANGVEGAVATRRCGMEGSGVRSGVKSVVESFVRLTLFFSAMCWRLTLAFRRCRVSARQPSFCLAHPVGRILCCGAKGPKTISTQVGTLNRSDASHGGADQLAAFRQGPLLDLSVSPISQLAGGKLVEAFMCRLWRL
jgi:hypothetical protein